MLRLCVIGGSLLLAACSGLSQEECTNADWEAIGFEDGVQGKGLEKVAAYRKDCAKHAVQVDLERYKYGRTVGLRDFCQPASAYQAGRRGYVYKGICPSDMEAAFTGPYEEGRIVFRAEQRLARAESALSSAEDNVQRIERKIDEHKNEMLDEKTDSDRRRKLYSKIEDYHRQLRRQKLDIDDLYEKVQQARRDFNDVQLQYGR